MSRNSYKKTLKQIILERNIDTLNMIRYLSKTQKELVVKQLKLNIKEI